MCKDLKIAGVADINEEEAWSIRKKIVTQLPSEEHDTKSENVIDTFCNNLGFPMSVKRVAYIVSERMQHLVEGKTTSMVTLFKRHKNLACLTHL